MRAPERSTPHVRRQIRDGLVPAPGAAAVEGASPDEVALTFDDNRLTSVVFGQYDQNIAKLERRLGVVANANGNHITLKGPPEACDHARRVLEALYSQVKQGRRIGLGEVDGAIEETAYQGVLFPKDADAERQAFDEIRTRKRGPVRARTAAQDGYLRALKTHELVFAEGPAGTGKTWLAVGHAVALLERGVVERLVLSRPAVEAGERLGFLPGDMKDKVDPYLRPIYDALHDFMDARMVERGMQTGMIEVAPLAFMRGRTLSNAVVLLDEAQNATSMQMKMFLTRLGEGSRMIINGDPTQIDLPPGQRSGLSEATALLAGVEGIAQVVFREGDVVRHDLVRRIVSAYERQGRALAQPREPVPPRQQGRVMPIVIDMAVEGGAWSRVAGLDGLVRGAVEAAAAEAGADLPDGTELSVLLCDDAAIRVLNRQWRGLDKATNVLSFPAGPHGHDGPRLLGDIAVAYETAEREAAHEGKAFAAHLTHLVVHGFLHLLAFDHDTEVKAATMEALETRVLAGLGLPDPYAGTEPAVEAARP